MPFVLNESLYKASLMQVTFCLITTYASVYANPRNGKILDLLLNASTSIAVVYNFTIAILGLAGLWLRFLQGCASLARMFPILPIHIDSSENDNDSEGRHDASSWLSLWRASDPDGSKGDTESVRGSHEQSQIQVQQAILTYYESFLLLLYIVDFVLVVKLFVGHLSRLSRNEWSEQVQHALISPAKMAVPVKSLMSYVRVNEEISPPNRNDGGPNAFGGSPSCTTKCSRRRPDRRHSELVSFKKYFGYQNRIRDVVNLIRLIITSILLFVWSSKHFFEDLYIDWSLGLSLTVFWVMSNAIVAENLVLLIGIVEVKCIRNSSISSKEPETGMQLPLSRESETGKQCTSRDGVDGLLVVDGGATGVCLDHHNSRNHPEQDEIVYSIVDFFVNLFSSDVRYERVGTEDATPYMNEIEMTEIKYHPQSLNRQIEEEVYSLSDDMDRRRCNESNNMNVYGCTSKSRLSLNITRKKIKIRICFVLGKIILLIVAIIGWIEFYRSLGLWKRVTKETKEFLLYDPLSQHSNGIGNEDPSTMRGANGLSNNRRLESNPISESSSLIPPTIIRLVYDEFEKYVFVSTLYNSVRHFLSKRSWYCVFKKRKTRITARKKGRDKRKDGGKTEKHDEFEDKRNEKELHTKSFQNEGLDYREVIRSLRTDAQKCIDRFFPEKSDLFKKLVELYYKNSVNEKITREVAQKSILQNLRIKGVRGDMRKAEMAHQNNNTSDPQDMSNTTVTQLSANMTLAKFVDFEITTRVDESRLEEQKHLVENEIAAKNPRSSTSNTSQSNPFNADQDTKDTESMLEMAKLCLLYENGGIFAERGYEVFRNFLDIDLNPMILQRGNVTSALWKGLSENRKQSEETFSNWNPIMAWISQWSDNNPVTWHVFSPNSPAFMVEPNSDENPISSKLMASVRRHPFLAAMIHEIGDRMSSWIPFWIQRVTVTERVTFPSFPDGTITSDTNTQAAIKSSKSEITLPCRSNSFLPANVSPLFIAYFHATLQDNSWWKSFLCFTGHVAACLSASSIQRLPCSQYMPRLKDNKNKDESIRKGKAYEKIATPSASVANATATANLILKLDRCGPSIPELLSAQSSNEELSLDDFENSETVGDLQHYSVVNQLKSVRTVYFPPSANQNRYGIPKDYACRTIRERVMKNHQGGQLT